MSYMRKKTEDLLEKIYKVLDEKPACSRLPQNTYYLSNDEILALPRKKGESRFPYDHDGLVVWAHSTGYIDAVESNFTIFKTAFFGEDSPVAFFGGIKKGEKYLPVSITGPGKQLDENIKGRYCIFEMNDVYYIADTDDAVFSVRMHVDKKKHIHFRQTAYSKTDKPIEIYLLSLFESLLRYAESETFWHRMSKFAMVNGYNSITLSSVNENTYDFLTINSEFIDDQPKRSYFTTARSDFLGSSGRTIENAECLVNGSFEVQQKKCAVADLPVASQIFTFELPSDSEINIEYELIYGHTKESAEESKNIVIDIDKIDKELTDSIEAEDESLGKLTVDFENWNDDKINGKVMSRFFRDLQKQTEFCALGKNYAGPALGIRDVFQQLEGSLMWTPEKSREKLAYAMNFILSDGRPPRQVTIPTGDDSSVAFDFHKYIDQGNWVISAFYAYLSFTGDFSILDETRSYYDTDSDTWGWGKKCEKQTTILEHLIRMTDYLISNIDPETYCLKVLYGDWNDALDGLGKTTDSEKDYGSGVTVMATLSLYRNLKEMSEILKKIGGFDKKADDYLKIREKVGKAMLKYCVDTDGSGNRRIIHGWGDKRSYLIGSFSDPDGIARYSTTSNAVWGYSDIMREDPSLKGSILEAFDAVDSKYGMKTFDVPFPKDLKKYVGRISTITPGTYENSCAYVHCSIFAICALFALGEPEKAWKQLEKSIVITHGNCNMTSFVMPNSYVENPEWCMDGESMGDWYTGSGATVVKCIVKYGFGIRPDLNGLTIQMPRVMPSKKAHIKIKIKDTILELNYENKGLGNRKITVDGNDVDGEFDELLQTKKIRIPDDGMQGILNVSIVD